MKRFLILLPLVLLCGCMSFSPTAKILKELKNDPATVDLQIMVPMYGSMIFHRSFPTNYIPSKP